MSFRRVIFWSHLSIGVAAGAVIFLLAVTGALLSFEAQITRLVTFAPIEIAEDAPRLDLPDLAEAALTATQGRASALIIERDPGLPVAASVGRGAQVLIDPTTGAVLDGTPDWLTQGFSTIEALHRTLALGGDARDAGRAVTGAATAVFVALLLSGVYLWWPKAWRWSQLRPRVWFRTGLPSAKARDFNWHHVLGFWALAPLLVITLSGLVLAYPSLRQALFDAYGETQGRRQFGGATVTRLADPRLAPIYAAASAEEGWNRLTLSLPAAGDEDVTVEIDRGTGRDPTAKTVLRYDLDDAALTGIETFADRSPATRAFLWMRFAHTGEYYGLAGQAVAGLASLAAAVMVYTGLALSYRRLLQPLMRRRKARAS